MFNIALCRFSSTGILLPWHHDDATGQHNMLPGQHDIKDIIVYCSFYSVCNTDAPNLCAIKITYLFSDDAFCDSGDNLDIIFNGDWILNFALAFDCHYDFDLGWPVI